MNKQGTFENECLELIQVLQDGGMISHPGIKLHVDRTLSTGDGRSLIDYLGRYPGFLRLARNNIARDEVQKRDNPFKPFPSQSDAKEYLRGPLKLGYVNEFGDMFGIHWDVFALPTIIPGRVGSGKSTIIKNLLSQILREDRDFNVIIPDLKVEYRDLLTLSPRIRVLTGKHIRINPLVVPSWMTPQEFIIFFSKVFCRENWVGATSEDVLNDEIEILFKKRGIFEGSENYPCMKDLYNLINFRLEKQKSFGFRDILLRLRGRIKTYLIGNTFSCRRGIPHDFWRKENVVLEMDAGFSDKIYSFTVSFIAGLNYTYSKKNRLMGSVLRSLLCVDEGRILFAVRDIETYGEAYISEIITKSREFGSGFIVASPETMSFNQTIQAIAYLKICGPLTDGNEKAAIKESFGLSEDQADHLFKLPRYGQAIIRYGSFERPFLLGVVPLYRLRKNLTDDEVEERMSTFYRELDAKVEEIETLSVRERPDAGQESETMENQKVPPAAMALLFYLSKDPYSRTKDLKKAPGFKSDGEARKAIDWLVEAGYVQREKHQISKSGPYPVFSVLTEKAYAQFDLKRRKGKGSFEHCLYQNLIQKNLESKGIKATIEGKIKGSNKLIDILVKDRKRGYIALEVVLSFQNLLVNVHKDFASGAAEVVIVARHESGVNQALKIVGTDPSLNPYLEKITFTQISDFFS